MTSRGSAPGLSISSGSSISSRTLAKVTLTLRRVPRVEGLRRISGYGQ